MQEIFDFLIFSSDGSVFRSLPDLIPIFVSGGFGRLPVRRSISPPHPFIWVRADTKTGTVFVLFMNRANANNE